MMSSFFTILLAVLICHSLISHDRVNGKFNAENALRRGLQEAGKVEQKLCSTDNGDKTWDESGGFKDDTAIPAHTAADGEWKIRAFTFTVDGVHYTFKDYAAQLFCHMRQQLFHIDHANYFASLSDKPLHTWSAPTKSGSTFLISDDGQFMLKSLLLDFDEHNFLKRHLGEYAEYLSVHGNRSFITRLLGLYSIETINISADEKEIVWFVAMPNILAPFGNNRSTDYRFDLKGCLFGRMVKAQEWEKAAPTLRDWEFNGPGNAEAIFPQGIMLDENVYRGVAEILSQDAKFLGEQLSVLDYSLFIGIHFNDANEMSTEDSYDTIHDPFAQMKNGGGLPAHSVGHKLHSKYSSAYTKFIVDEEGVERSISIVFGIVDIMLPWNSYFQQKKIRRCYANRQCHESEQPLVSPQHYAARFQCFVNREVFRVENEGKMRKYAAKYCEEFEKIDWLRETPQLNPNKHVEQLMPAKELKFASSSSTNFVSIAAAMNEGKCGEIPLSMMEMFKFVAEPDYPGGQPLITADGRTIAMAPMVELLIHSHQQIGSKSQHSNIYIGYLGSKTEMFDARKCVAIKLTGLNYESNAKNCFRTIKEIRKRLPLQKRRHIIDVLYLGRTHEQQYVTVMELATGSFDSLYVPVDFNSAENIVKLEKHIENMVVPLVEMHEVALHQDMKMANYALVEGVMKLIDFDGSVLLPDAAKGLPNFELEPQWKFRIDNYSGPEFEDKHNVKVSRKADIWSIGMLIHELFLLQPRNGLGGDSVNALMYKISSLYRGYTWTDVVPHVIRGDGRRDQISKRINFDTEELLVNYADALEHVLRMRLEAPRIFLLVTNCLDMVPSNRMSAAGIFGYMRGYCKPPGLHQFPGDDQNIGEYLSTIFGLISAEKLLKMIESHSLVPGTTTPKHHYNKNAYSKMNLLKILLLEGTAKIEETVAALEVLQHVCEH